MVFITTAYTSLLFAIPAALLRCSLASACFAVIVPVSFVVHAVGGAQWAIDKTLAGRTLVRLDKLLANCAAASTVFGVYRNAFVAYYSVPFYCLLGLSFVMYHVFYPKPPKCWVKHHAAFHIVVVTGCWFAYMCGA